MPATMSPSGRNRLTAKVEVQLPVYDLSKPLGFASSIDILYIRFDVRENMRKCWNSESQFFSLTFIG